VDTDTSDQGVEHAPSEQAEPEVHYDLDVTAEAAEQPSPTVDADQPAAPAPSPAPPASTAPAADPVAELRERNFTLERTVNELRSQFGPLIEERTRALTEAATKPPVSLERLQSGEATADELLAYIDWQNKRGLSDIQNQIARQTRIANSEAEARGKFSADAMGAPDRSYDQMRSTYLEPAFSRDPALRSHVHALAPDNPALAEMAAAVILRTFTQHKGHEVRALRSIMDALNARVDGAKETTDKITEAARRGADKALRERGPGAERRKVDSQAIWNMTDAEFENLRRQQGVA
jgi:hypothetical protein